MQMEPCAAAAYQVAEHRWGKAVSGSLKPYFLDHSHAIRELRKASEVGQRQPTRAWQNMLLKSFSSKLTCLVRSGAEELSVSELLTLAGKIDPRTDCGEPIAVFAKEKDNGDFRPVAKFGCMRRALQRLCRDIVDAKFGMQLTAYLEKGRGADRAADKIKEFSDTGLRWFAILDIKDFYPSVQHDKLAGLLGLPKEVIRNSLTISEEVLLTTHSTTHSLQTLTGAVRQGIPQGSGASTSIANVLLGTLLEQVAPAARALHYGDDVLVACCSREEAGAVEKALCGHLQAHPCGPFQLKRSEVRHISRGFDFLKYAYRLDSFDGHLRVAPAGRSFRRFSEKVRALFQDLPPTVAMDKLDALAPRWIASFPHWQPVSLSLLNLETTIINAAFDGLVLNETGDTMSDTETLIRLRDFQLSSKSSNAGLKGG